MTTTIDIQGTCEPRFSAVRDAFANNFAHGRLGEASLPEPLPAW